MIADESYPVKEQTLHTFGITLSTELKHTMKEKGSKESIMDEDGTANLVPCVEYFQTRLRQPLQDRVQKPLEQRERAP